MSAEPEAKRSRSGSAVPDWVETARHRVESIAEPAWFVTGGTLELEEDIPDKPFTFTVPARSFKYIFQYQDGSTDVDDQGKHVCAGAWDAEFGTHRQYDWVAGQHFDYIVTRNEECGPIRIEARLASTQLELATTLLDHAIHADELDQ
jgi:hypothetical protein